MKTKFFGALLILMAGLELQADPVTSAFYFSHQLTDNGSLATGAYDFTFTLFDALINGNAVAGPVTNSAVSVTSGSYTTLVDFGTNLFNGTSYWLEVAVRQSGAGGFSTLSPRQPILANPYASYALMAGSAVTASSVQASNVLGQLGPAQLPAGVLTNNASEVTLHGSFSGNGQNLILGPIPAALISPSVLTNGASGVTLQGSFSGDGGNLTNLNFTQQLPPGLLSNNATGVTLQGSFSGDGSKLTNLNFTSTTLSPMGTSYGAQELAGNWGWEIFYGGAFIDYLTNSFTVTNIACSVGGMGSNVTAALRVFQRPDLASFNIRTTVPVYSNLVTIPPWQGGGSLANIRNFAIPPCPVAANSYFYVTFEVPNTGMFNFAYWSGSAGNPDSRLPYAFLEAPDGLLQLYGPTYWYANASAELSGYVSGQGLNSLTLAASQVTYSPNPSVLNLGFSQNAQAAIDALANMATTSSVPLLSSKTVVVLDGDSKMVGLGSYLTNLPWWNSVGFVTNVAVGGTHLADATNWWATNTASFSSLLHNGTNGLYVLWDMHNDVGLDPYLEIEMLSNHLARVVRSNWNVMVLTVQPRASSQTDTPDSWSFVSIVNNWIRSSPLCWRVVEAERLMPNCYDPTFYADTTHLTPLGYSNVAWAVQRQLFTPAYSPLPQEWMNVYGTNNIVAVPGANNSPGSIAAFFTASGLFLPPNNNAWPGSALVPGACCFVNSNGTVYLLTSRPGSTTWAATNKLGGL